MEETKFVKFGVIISSGIIFLKEKLKDGILVENHIKSRNIFDFCINNNKKTLQVF